VTAEVLRAPLDRFVATRAEAVRELRRKGQGASADRIAALRKPSVVVWALNQAGVVAERDLDALRGAGDELRHAQERVLAGDRAAATAMERALLGQRQHVDALTRRLGMVLSASGRATSDETVRRIRDALRTASNGDAEAWLALRSGRLTAEPEAASFPMMDVPLANAVVQEHSELERQAHEKRVDAAEAEVHRAEELERMAREQAQAAQLRLDQATQTLDEARAALEGVRKR